MLSNAEIGRILGVTRMQAGRLVAKGCPKTSGEEVLKWRKENPPKRAPTRGNRVEHRAGDKAGDRVEKSHRQNEDAGVVGKPVVRKIARLERTGDSLYDALMAAIYVSDQALEEYVLACEGNSPSRSVRLSEHNKALDARLKAEKAYREELERRGVLVDRNESFQVARMAIEAVLRRLKRLPVEVGPQCNPGDPAMATKVLSREVEEIIRSGAKEINGLRGTK
jgi:hypothetical protein